MDLGLGQHLQGVADLLVGIALVLGALRSAAFQLLADLIEGGEQHEAVGGRRAVAGRGEIALVHGELGLHQFEHLLLHSRELGAEAAERETLYGAAVVQTGVVRRAGLDALACEPPPHHANLIYWPVLGDDPELQKARRKEIATEIAEEAWYLPCK